MDMRSLMQIVENASKGDKLDLPSIEVGDEVLVGKFKNRKATVKGFAKDDNNQPVLKTDKGDQKLFKPRLTKLMDDDITVMEAEPSLTPAIRHDGRVYTGGEIHRDVENSQKDRQIRGDLQTVGERGFVNDKGHFLTRAQAHLYAIKHDLMGDHVPEPYRSQPSEHGLTSGLLKGSDTEMRYKEDMRRRQRMRPGE